MPKNHQKIYKTARTFYCNRCNCLRKIKIKGCYERGRSRWSSPTTNFRERVGSFLYCVCYLLLSKNNYHFWVFVRSSLSSHRVIVMADLLKVSLPTGTTSPTFPGREGRGWSAGSSIVKPRDKMPSGGPADSDNMDSATQKKNETH